MQKTLKQAITIVCIVGSVLIILDSLNAGNSLMLFLFAGIIPGTNIVISSTNMLIALVALIGIVILRFVVWPIVRRLQTVTTPVPVTRSRAKRTTRTTA